MSDINVLLELVIKMLNEIVENPSDDSHIKEYGLILAEEYFTMKKKKIDILSILDQEFSEDTELYLLVLSILFFVLKEKQFLDKSEQLLLKGDLSYDNTIGVLLQTKVERFRNIGMENDYENQRKLYGSLTNRLKEELKADYSFIPWNERNHQRILIVTNTLLPEYHAPTKVVLKTAKTLQETLGYEVQILVNVENFDIAELQNMWIYPCGTKYFPQYNKEFTIQYKGVELQGFQQLVDQDHFSQIREMIKRVQEWKPEMIWYIGGTSVITEILSEISTLAAMPCTNGYAVSNAQVLVSYMKNGCQIPEIERFIRSNNQKMLCISLSVVEYKQTNVTYQPKDFGLPEDGFIIAIVGNRLNAEIDENFIRIMEKIVEREENVYFLMIGKDHMDWKNILKDRVVNLGFQKDLIDILKATKLFLNPARKGGGGGGTCAIAAEVPVLTLGNCDVAHVGEAFVCQSLEDYPEIVSRYCHDFEFYQNQVLKCKEKKKRIFNIDYGKECQIMLEQLTAWLKEGLIK